MQKAKVAPARPRTKAGKAARGQRVAAAIVAGKSMADIGRQERVSRATASRLGNSQEVQLLVTALVEAEGTRIRGLFSKALTAVEESFTADKAAIVTEKGTTIEGGPDHYARLTGVKCLTALLTAGRSAQKPEPPARKSFTLDELKQVLQEAQTAGVQ